jgi:hypothetical protein
MNLLGIDLKPVINKINEHTAQQAQIIALLQELVESNQKIKQILQKKEIC